MMASFDGRVVVVTGASSGIGAALARVLVADGARVLAVARDETALQRLAGELGPQLQPVACDLADVPARGRAIERILALAEGIDALVSNAGACVYASPLDFDLARWRALFELNVWAGVDLVQRLAPRLRAGAHVVHVSSVTARFLPNARFAPYAITKATIDRIAEAQRLELDARGVRVSVVAPGLVDTPIYDKVEGFARTQEKIRGQVPRWLDAGDVADAIAWILTRPPHVAVADLTLLPVGQSR